MIRIALTGSIGMGKSTVATMFAAAGVPVFDADAEVHRMQGPDGLLVSAIAKAFPEAMDEGGLDRARLAALALADPARLADLEAIVHPAVAAARADFVGQNSGEKALLFEIPLLFETHGERDYDRVVVVSAPADVQRRRVLLRDGMTQNKLDSILARQIPDSQKRARADFVIDTSGDLSTTKAQVARILACLGLGERD